MDVNKSGDEITLIERLESINLSPTTAENAVESAANIPEPTNKKSRVLIIEPFYGGSHKELIDTITSEMDPSSFQLITMSAKKWHWRARCSSLYISQAIENAVNFNVMFCSSVVSLAELIGIRPELASLKKIIYFHENQLIYPIQSVKERDFQYGYNQITSCLSADEIIFNSEFNKTSFLDNIKPFLKMMPDYRMKNVAELIRPKCRVIYFPVNFHRIQRIERPIRDETSEPYVRHIIWPHRWEFDKNPKSFFDVIYRLHNNGINFKVSIVGECPSNEVPAEFKEFVDALRPKIVFFGYLPDKEAYYKALNDADIVVSTAIHEFFGVAMMEAVYCGCLPLVPNRVVYPEIYPKEYLYGNDNQLYRKLKSLCTVRGLVEKIIRDEHIDTTPYSAQNLVSRYLELFE